MCVYFSVCKEMYQNDTGGLASVSYRFQISLEIDFTPFPWGMDGGMDGGWLVSQRPLKKTTLSSFRYELLRLKLKFGERSFLFSGPKLWNSLPFNLQELTNTDTFKKLLKSHLSNLAFGELE